MLTVPVVNMKGVSTGEMQVDPETLGGRIRPKLIKQAIVVYLARQRQGSARTKGRSDVEGSTRKLYRQKGTGNARAGSVRTPIRRGGGRTFSRRIARRMPWLSKKMRRLARDSAILAKIQANEVMVIEDLACPQIRTKPIASMLTALDASRGCLVAMHERDDNVYRSGRNIPKTDFRLAADLSAYEILRRPKVLFTKIALTALLARDRAAGGSVEKQ